MSTPVKSQLVALLGAVVVLALPTAAAAEYYIPPGNSAANQYTEALPDAGGDTGGERNEATPGQALGERNAKLLEKKGPAGEEAARGAADTAPAAQVLRGEPGEEAAGAATGHGDDKTTGGAANAATDPGAGTTSGSSGVGEVVAQTTGASGDLGLWLPLAILTTLVGSVIYRLRHRAGAPV